MPTDKIHQLQQGLHTAFIDANNSSNLAYRPQFVSNNYKEGRKYSHLLKMSFWHVRNFLLV